MEENGNVNAAQVGKPYAAYGEASVLFEWLAGKGKPPLECLVSGVAGCGKSRLIAEFLVTACRNFGASVLVLRKTRVDLAKSFLKILENEVLGPGHPWVLGGPQRENRMVYRKQGIPGEIVCAGMEDPTRVFSTQYDLVFWNEATEADQEQWETLHRALRAGPMPFRLLLGDCNPDSQYHWLRKRCDQGRCLELVGHFWDNPLWYDHEKKAWTPAGVEYLGRLNYGQSGHVRKRLYEGIWVAAEGQVWSNFDPKIHMIDRSELPELVGHFGSIDWGYTAPGVFQVWGVDRARRLYRVAEVYRTGKTIEWWSMVAERLIKDYGIQSVVADPSRPDNIEMMNDRLYQAGAPACIGPADNRRTARPGAKMDMVGLDLVRWGFDPDETGVPRIRLVKNALLEGRDPVQTDKGQPCCFEEEIPAYVYKKPKDGRPSDEDTDPGCVDHGADAGRQACMHAWRSDYAPDVEAHSFKPGTYGSVLNMRQALEDAGILESA